MIKQKEITRITIKGTCGCVDIDHTFNDVLSITNNSISYTYNPIYVTPNNQYIKWSYKTNSNTFKEQFNKVVSLIPDVINYFSELIVTDVPTITFIITYSDKTRYKDIRDLMGDEYETLFSEIRKLIPQTEKIPALLEK